MTVGILGIFVPILPTTPFLLLAAACYMRSSQKMYYWLLNNKLFGSYIKNYIQGKGIPLNIKVFTVILLWITIGLSAWFATQEVAIRFILILVTVGVTTHIVLIKTLEKTKRREEMKQRLYYYPLAIVILAVLLGFFGWFTESSSIRWIAPAFGLALIAVGLSVNSLIIALHTEKKATEMGAALARIESLQEEIRKEQNERVSSGPSIVASLEAMSQYYMDYINKQKGEENK